MTVRAANPTDVDYSTVTEIAGEKGSREQLERLFCRYYFATAFCQGKDVLEAACGTGQGLGLLARSARSVTGLDLDPKLLGLARATYATRPEVRLVAGNAEDLPFPEQSFDVVILFEAIYYLPHPEAFVKQAKRVLRPGGVVLVCTANKDLPDFNPSPYSHAYFGPPELRALFERERFSVELLGEAPVRSGIAPRAVRMLKRAAVRFHLMPKTMRGKRVLKRIFMGRLKDLPREVPPGLRVANPVPISADGPARGHLVIHCVARI
jgi:ubiquinone/menaquinone biosynthesis C-methylase UbiE